MVLIPDFNQLINQLIKKLYVKNKVHSQHSDKTH